MTKLIWGPEAVSYIASQELLHRKACFKQLRNLRNFGDALHYAPCLLSFAVFNYYIFFYFQNLVSGSLENGVLFEPRDNPNFVDPIRSSDQLEVDREIEAQKAHEETNKLNEWDACPNTYLPEGSYQKKMQTEIDPETDLPLPSFCGCNENEFLEALPT